jgi:cobalt-zinc-cadmium efflux system outer membrane protein
MTRNCWRAAIALLCVAITGCAGVPLEAGRTQSLELVRQRVTAPVGDAAARSGAAQPDAAVERQLSEWLASPLTLDAAVRIALLRNPQLQSAWAQLGLSAADVFEAGHLQNPGVSAALLMPLGDATGNKFSAGASLGFSELLLHRASKRMADAQFSGTQATVAYRILAVVSDTQRAWVDAVAASQRLAVRQSVREAAEVTADLAGRYAEAGNLNPLALQVQRAAASEARIAVRRAEAEFLDARTALLKQLGLGTNVSWTLPQSLPAVGDDAALVLSRLQTQAREQRLDLIAARHQVDALTGRRDATRRYRYVTRGDIGASFEREAEGSRRLGPSASLELPLFQQGQGRVARADAELQQALGLQRELELAVDADVQQQLQRVALARDAAAAYHEALIPQREAIVARLQEQANYMLVDTFSVLLAKQQEYAAYDGYVDAVEDYWRSRVALLRAVGTQLAAALPVATEDTP